ncbi:MAG: hypothetical protein AB7E95_08420 [Kiritimatiellales bacterium]
MFEQKKTAQDGFVMVAALMMLLIGALAAGSFVFVARQSHPSVTQWENYDRSLLAAQSALEKVKSDLYEGFRDAHALSRSWNDLEWVEAHASDYSTSGTIRDLIGTSADLRYSDAEVTVTVANGEVTGISVEEKTVYVTNTAVAVYNGVTRAVEEVVRYTLNRSSVFDHAYFINNFGWFHGVDCVVNGDIRSNYDVELKSRDLILNGYSYAAGVNDINKPYQTWSWRTYKNNSYSEYFRPTYNVDQNTKNDASIFEFGYDDSDTYNYVTQLDMPYIGNLSDYRYYAQEQNGTVSLGGKVAVSNVYSGTGPSGVEGAPDQGTKYLYGTEEDPIVIDGPVVVDGDVMIGGYYTGQGTIYAGRNIHVISDLIALNDAQWVQPDTVDNFTDNTLPDNLARDFLGLCAKGAVVLGDYRTLRSSSSYFKPPFTGEYEVSAADADIGYISYVRDGKNYFDGDYTGFSGYRCASGDPSESVPRNFYEPSVSEAEFASYSPSRELDRLDAFIYNNHLTIGRLGSNSMINGGIICRDEALFPDGRIYMNWDCRVALDNDFSPFLPMDLGPAETIQWRELE